MTAINDRVSVDREGEVAVVTVDNPPVNALSHPVRAGLREAMEAIGADPDVRAVVLHCAGRTFIAGADITEFGRPFEPPGLLEVLDALEGSSRPVVAAIHGTALGGGLEVALACHFRVATPDARLGLPEVKLGLIPGAGGTQRLPRVVGPEKALEMIVGGEPIGAQEAEREGLVDAIVEGELRAGAIAFARRVLAEGLGTPRVRDRDEKVAPARGQPGIFESFRARNARRLRGFEAPEACIEAVRAAVELPFEEGLAREQALFAERMASDQAKAQQYFFFAEREAARIPDVPRDTPVQSIGKAAVIGAGTMGGGISMCFANAGIPVTMVEANAQALERGVATIRRNYETTASKGRLSAADVEQRMGLIRPSLELAEVADADIVIEAVFEDMELKKDVFRRLDQSVREGAVLATNTSALDVNEIASVTRRPEKVIGTHFFSPANVMRLVEVVRGERTDAPTIATAMALARRLGKVPVLVGVCHGFVGNRMLYGRQREAQKLILEGALPQDVDRVLYEFGFPMGPFAMSDLAGLDIGWKPETSTGSTIRERLCEAGRRGQKTGAGYYDYEPGSRTPRPSPEVERIILEFAERAGIERREVTDEEILTRCLYPMVNEGARILEEGVAIRASDIDVVWVYGYGWPVYRGGPMYWAEQQGLANILATLEAYRARFGDDWTPAPLLAGLAREGKGFRDVKPAR